MLILFVAGAGVGLCAPRKTQGAISSPILSPDGKRVAFLYTHDENTDVVVAGIAVGADAGNSIGDAINVSDTPGAERDLAWSPDGSMLLFSSQQEGSLEICAFDVKSEQVECLTDSPKDDFFPVWRRDGKQIAFCSYRDGRYRVYTMNADGSGQKPFYKEGACYPTWSPDGEKMALTYNGDIIVVNIKTGREKNITRPLVDGDWVEDSYPQWSPTKDRIILIGRYEAYLTELYALSSGGKKLSRLSDNVYEDFYPSWSPDGKWVVYAQYVPNRRNTTEIYMSREDNSDKRRLTKNWVFDLSPTFSPDGEWVLFIRRDGLKDKIYVMDTVDEEDPKAEKQQERPLFSDGFRITRSAIKKSKP